MATIFLSLFSGLCFATGCYVLAKRNGKDPFLWAIAGFLFGLFALLALLIFSHYERKRQMQQQSPSAPQAAPLPPAPAIVADPLASNYWYYLDAQNQSQGPMNLEQLTAAWQATKIHARSYVWYDKLTEWKRVEELAPLNEKLKR